IMPKIDLNTIISAKTNSNKPRDPKDTPEEREQRTIREMAIMRLLRHPNICQLKEYISEEDKYYMFLEYVDGGQLLDYIIKNGKLREKQARKFARQIISALGIDQLKIIDFGLSNVYSPNQQLDTFCGSLYFAAPELLKARQYIGPEVDVWSFGVVLYVLVCGKVPFDDSNLPALHEKIKAGVIEEYPEHLGKECLDLLSKIFVVDPSRRITLTGIKAHPWMNKGYEEPIRNYLPRRQPLETIDMDIVRGMNGFGLGSPEEIKERLEKIISFPAYQEAAMKIDENYQIAAQDDPSTANKSRWRRSLSTSRKRKVELSDDFQSLPAMYDPLISIYHLVKERRETEERKKQLLNAPSAPVTGLSRSTSTFVAGRKSNQPTSRDSSHQHNPHVTTLTRRRTYDTSKKLPALPPINHRPSKQSSDIIPPKPQSSWKRLSMHRKSPTRLSFDTSSSPVVTTSLKSLFQFNNRGHLFRMTPNQLITELKLVLYQLDIEILSVENYQLNCRCNPHVVATYASKEGRVTLGEDYFVFFVMVYEARYAGGKIGIKVKEQQHHDGTHNLYSKQLLRNLYHDILSKIKKK
ncbi:MAG: kinase-like domain-containing protein, partial [Benjaminiella poitrasii]